MELPAPLARILLRGARAVGEGKLTYKVTKRCFKREQGVSNVLASPSAALAFLLIIEACQAMPRSRQQAGKRRQ